MLRTRTWPSERAGTGASTISKCSARGMPDGLDFSLTCRFARRCMASTSRVHSNAHILSTLASPAFIPPYWFPRVLPGGLGDVNEMAQDLGQGPRAG